MWDTVEGGGSEECIVSSKSLGAGLLYSSSGHHKISSSVSPLPLAMRILFWNQCTKD